MAGLPGSGKTTLARALAGAVGGVVISKDDVRAALFPGELTDYSAEQDDLCMKRSSTPRNILLLTVAYRLCSSMAGPSRAHTRLNKSFVPREECGAGWKILHLTVPDEVARARLQDAEAAGHLAKNRDFKLYLEVKARSEPITRPKLDVDTSQPLEDCVQKCKAYLLAR